MKDLYAMLGGVFVLILLLVGMLFWGSIDFANRCERAGGVNISYQVCVPAGTKILMTS